MLYSFHEYGGYLLYSFHGYGGGMAGDPEMACGLSERCGPRIGTRAMRLLVVLPDQLFWPPPSDIDEFWLLEEPHYFTEYDYAPAKLALHRRSLDAYEKRLRRHREGKPSPRSASKPKGARRAPAAKPVRRLRLSLEAALRRAAKQKSGKWEVHMWVPASVLRWAPAWPRLPRAWPAVVWHDPPNFLLSQAEADMWAARLAGQKSASLAAFYRHMRLGKVPWLQDGRNRPLGGKWSLDAHNRSGFGSADTVLLGAKGRLSRRRPAELGATTHRKAENLLADFVERHLLHFGDYQDAVFGSASKDARRHADHSLLSCSLNLGLLTPEAVLEAARLRWEALSAAEQTAALPSVEGFVRQVSGWREFMRVVYLANRRRQPVPRFAVLGPAAARRELGRWYAAALARREADRTEDLSSGPGKSAPATGLAAADLAAEDLGRTGYLHHIRRLMTVGVWMLLRGLPPQLAYRWFLELGVDAYEWVMWGNVYGMVYWCLAPNPTGRPYLATSRYLRRQDETFAAAPSDSAAWDAQLAAFVKANRARLRGLHPNVTSVLKAVGRKTAEKSGAKTARRTKK